MTNSRAKASLILLRNAVIALTAFAAGRLAYDYIGKFIRIDAFSALRPRNAGVSDEVGIELKSVSLRHYHGMKLVTTAQIQRVDVSKDRQSFDLYNVTDGVYHGNSGEVHYAALKANWSAINRVLNVTERAHVWNADLNLETSNLTLEQKKQQVTAPKEIHGRLFDGQMTAGYFQYGIDTGEADAGSLHWMGTFSMLQDQPDTTPRKWDVQGDHYKRSKNSDVEQYTNGVASDGEIIIKAPKIERQVKSDVLTATGRVMYFSSKANVSADKVVVYRKERRAVLTGNVQMFVKPKKDKDKPPAIEEIPPFRPFVPVALASQHPTAPAISGPQSDRKATEDQLRSAKNARDYPMSVKAERIEYWYHKGERRALINGDIQARQEFPNLSWRHIWTAEGQYDGEKETLKLISSKGKKDTRMKNSLGDDLIATWLLFSTKEDDDEYEGEGVTGVVFNSDDELPRDKPKDPSTPAVPPTSDSSPGAPPADKPKQSPP